MSKGVLTLMTALSDRCLLQTCAVEPTPQKSSSGWTRVEDVLKKNYTNADVEAARVLCAAMAAHSLKEFPPAWCLAIAPPGSAKTDLLESFRGLPRIHFVDELTPKT